MNNGDRKEYATTVNPGPVLRPGELWLLNDIREVLGIPQTTIQRWQQNGFRVLYPGTRSGYCWSDTVIQFIKDHPTADHLKPLEPNYKRKRDDDAGSERVSSEGPEAL